MITEHVHPFTVREIFSVRQYMGDLDNNTTTGAISERNNRIMNANVVAY